MNSNLLKGYQPSPYVQYASTIPVMSHALAKMGGVQGGDPRFAPTSFKYLAPIVALPATAFLLGILSMFFMNVGLMLRCCFRPCACFPSKATREDNSRRRWRLTASLWLFSCLLLVSVGLIYLADSNLDLGIAELQRLLRLMHIVLTPINADAQSLASVGNSLATSLTAAKAACSSAAAMVTTVSTLATQTKMLAGLMSAIIFQVDTIQLYIDLYLASESRRQALYALAALPILLALGFMVFSVCRCSTALKVLIGSGVIYYYIAVIALLPIMAVVSLLSDVCSDPFNKVLQAAPHGGRVYNLTHFYTTCEGDNIAGGYLEATWQAAVATNSSINALLGTTAGGACSATDKNLLEMRIQSGLALSTMTIAAQDQHLPSCSIMNSVYTSLVSDAVCGYLFMGMLQVAGALMAGTLALWLCVVLASILSPHLDSAFFQQMVYVGDGNDDGDDDEGGREGGGNKKKYQRRRGWSWFGLGGVDDEDEDEDQDEDEEEDEEGVGGEGKRGDDRIVHADISQAEKEGRSTTFDWASLSEDMTRTEDKCPRGGGGGTALTVSRIPDEEDEEDDELVSIGGWGFVAGGGDVDGSVSVSVLTRDVPREALSPEEALHGLAVVPAGREDEL